MDLRTLLVGLAHAALLAVGLLLVIVDARTHRLPNRIVLPTLAVAAGLIVVDAGATGRWAPLLRAGAGMLLLCGFYLLLRAVSRAGLGGGDVKLSAVVGLVLGWHGWQALAVGAASAFVLAAVYAIALMALRRADGSTRIAFGPWMVAGAVIGVIAGGAPMSATTALW
ncbi:MAG: prepilin peptidase [Microbacterium sp.]|nr:prepilin peptidase [Microbacterium sp.]